jgi:hypothetical protein
MQTVRRLRGARAVPVARVGKVLALASILLIKSAHLIRIGLVVRAESRMANARVAISLPKSLLIQQKAKRYLHPLFLGNLMLL